MPAYFDDGAEDGSCDQRQNYDGSAGEMQMKVFGSSHSVPIIALA